MATGEAGHRPPRRRPPDALAAVVGRELGRLRHLDGLDGPVGVACSGGPDSLALLALAAAAGLAPVAVHVDHGLRPGSPLEAGVVAACAAEVGAPTVSVAVRVGPGPGVEARAREARYGALGRVAAQRRLTAVLVGHTADDQAETVLLHLLRGGATAGLAGMPPRRGPFVRPLLSLRRADTRQVCARLGWSPVEDPSNDDRALRRVWLRREVLPELARAADRDVVPVLARQAEVLREESDLLDSLAADAVPVGPGEAMPAALLAGAGPVLARRAVRRWLGPPPPSLAEVEAVRAAADGGPARVELSGGRTVRRAGGMLLAGGGRDGERSATPGVPVPLPGRAGGHGVRLEARVERAAPAAWPDGRSAAVLDADTAGPAGVLHASAGGGVTLADRAGEPLWHLGYGVAPRARPGHRTRRFLWVSAAEG